MHTGAKNSELLVHVHLNPRVSTSELKENWNDNLAAIFEATHDGCHVRMEWKICRLKDVCFQALNSRISTRKKAKNFQQYRYL
jgi:hypothetical protein